MALSSATLNKIKKDADNKKKGIKTETTTTTGGTAAKAGAAASSAKGTPKKETEEKTTGVSSVLQKKIAKDVEYKKLGITDPAETGRKGYNRYLAEKEKEARAKQEEEDNKKWWEKVFDYMGDSPHDHPGSNFTLVVDALREDTTWKEPTDKWNDSQKRSFGLLYETKGRKAAEEYAISVNNSINKADTEKQKEELQDKTNANFGTVVGGVVGNAVLGIPSGWADLMTINAEAVARGQITDKNILSPFQMLEAYNEDITKELNQKGTIDDAVNKALDKFNVNIDADIPVIGDKGWGEVYGIGSSVAQSQFMARVFPHMSPMFFGPAAASAFYDARERGASDEQAIALGASAGLAEVIGEALGMESLLGIKSSSTFKGIMKNIIKQSVSEGYEEGMTSVMNNVADQFIMGDRSNFNIMVQELVANGMSEEEAKKTAWIKFAEDVAFDSIAGGVSGGFGGTIQTVGQNIAANSYAKSVYGDSVNELIEEGLSTAEGTRSHELAQEYKAKIEDGKTLSGAEIRLMVEANEQQFTIDDTAKIQEAAANRLRELGESDNVDAIAQVLAKQAGGETITKAEQKTLGSSTYGQRVSNELNPENIQSGGYASDWTGNIGTNRINADLYNLARETAGVKATQDAPKATQAEAGEKIDSSETSSKPETETAAQGEFKVSDNGKTFNLDTGDDIKIADIASIKDGKMTFKLEDGTEISTDKVSFGNTGEALVYETVANLPNINAAAAKVLVKNMDLADVSSEVYAKGIEEAYRFGTYNIPAAEMMADGAFARDISEQQRTQAYRIGQSNRKASIKAKESTMSQVKKADSKAGKVHFEGNKEALNQRQKTSIKVLERIASVLGVEIYLFESPVVNGKRQGANGWYDKKDGSIHLDIFAGQNGEATILFTAAHELVHFLKDRAPAKFDVLADFLMEEYGKKGVSVDELVRAQQAKARRNGRELSYGDAYEEVIADSMETMLADGKVMEKLAKLKAKDQTLWEHIKSFIDDLVNKIKEVYAGLSPNSAEGRYVAEMKDSLERIQELFTEGLIEASENMHTIGSIDLEQFADAKNTEGEQLFQYRAMEADEDTYRSMLKKWGKFSDAQINNLFTTIDKAMDIIKDNLEILDYAWEADINDRAFSPVKPNSDSLYQVSIDFSTLCRKRLLQQTVQAQLQEALKRPMTKEEGIAIRDALMAIQEEGRQIEIACALCYVESARMKSPAQIKKFLENREAVLKDFFASKSGGDIKGKIKQAEADARERLGVGDASLKSLSNKIADQIRAAKKEAKASYKPTAEEQKFIDAAMKMTVSDFTTPAGLENLAKNYRGIFDAYTSYVRNATKSKGIENDTWWRAGDSEKIGDTLIANMNKENGLRSQSWSDFQVIHMMDYIAAVIELSTRNSKMQAYTKVPDYVELMGKTGAMINLSLIPTRDYLGSLDYDSTEGMDYKKSLELRDKYHGTVGTICIGIDNNQIKQLFEDMTIDYVIPYHKSGMSAHVRKAMHLPTWSEYELYQSESNLSDAQAKANADKYGVELLDKSDPDYHKHTSFSEWFDLKEAQQIAKMENANPSDPVKQKKYGVMYGGYMAMQNAANNYLKLCAERGLAPVFSHKNADFTGEDNYWKVLIDRKMVDNITGEVIEQKAIQPVFDEAEVLRILNDELERYPKVKEDQEYAIRRVTEKFLSGDIKGGMSSSAVAKAMQKPVDNISSTNIVEAGKEMDGVKLSDRDSDGRELSEEQQEFFKDSQVRWGDKLMPVYHGTRKEFTVFDATKGYDENRVGGLLWAAKDYEYAKDYSSSYEPIVMKGYLNITNLLDVGDIDGYLNYESRLQELADLVKKTPSELEAMANYDSVKYIYDITSSKGFRDRIVELGYDGVVAMESGLTTYGFVNSNQFKSVDNKTPTTDPDIRYSLREVEPIQPTSDKWERTSTTSEVMARFPNLWNVAAEESETRNPTQITGTVKSYRKIYDYLKAEGFDGNILDASSGLGYGTRAGIEEYGFDVEDIEPYPDKNYHPKYKDYSSLDKKYDVIISNAVLNVIPQDQRDALVVKMGELLNEGGRIFINVRGKDVENASSKVAINEDLMEYYISNTGSYQKGFTKDELVAYLQDALGDGFTVEKSNMFGAVSAVVTKDRGIKYHGRDYSYEALVNKPDMKLTTVDDTVKYNRADAVYYALKNAASVGYTNENGNAVVHVKDTNTDVIVPKKGLVHGLDRRFESQVPVLVKIGNVLENSIRVNELVPRSETVSNTYVLIGAARGNNGLYIVSFVVNRFSNEVTEMDVLYSANAKKESAALLPKITDKSATPTDSTISIASLLDYVNKYFPDILPEEVLKHYGYDSRPEGTIGESALYQDREDEGLSNRAILANALEGAAQNDIEKRHIQEYKDKIDLINSEEAHLHEVNEQIKELSFAKGPRDTKKLKELHADATRTANRISTFDKQLLRLEASKPLQDVIDRERKMAYKRAQQKGKEAVIKARQKAAETQREIITRYQESRKKAVEGRHSTEVRNKIKRVVNELNTLLTRQTKEKHVPLELQKPVAAALDMLNLDDTRYYDSRIKSLDEEIANAKTKEERHLLEEERNKITDRRQTFEDKIKSLKEAYEAIGKSNDPYISLGYNASIAAMIDNVSKDVGNTLLRDMSKAQLEKVYELYKVVLKTVRDANKLFVEGKTATVVESGIEAINELEKNKTIESVSKSKLNRMKFFWNNLKPVYAFKRMGSETLEGLFNNIRKGEDTWATDIREAIEFHDRIVNRYGYKKWDFKKTYTFTSNTGRKFKLNLGQMMSLYAYSKRDQAYDHLTDGGFVFDSNETFKKNGKEYVMNVAKAYNISVSELQKIVRTLSTDQRHFVDEMQKYLSEVMGEKGNEISRAMYDINLFKGEDNYFPLRSAEQFLVDKNEVTNETKKLVNSGFTKPVQPGANNPIVLSDFMDIWAGHVNNMSMYHAFVKPIEDFNRVYNVQVGRSAENDSDSVKSAMQSAFTSAANDYVEQLLKDINGGARTDSRESAYKRLIGNWKKASVFASASVVIQQPSAIGRAFAEINPIYFVMPTKVSSVSHKKQWEQLKKYAPVAFIKEMGYFDTDMGKSTVDYIKGDKTLKDKLDDFAGKAPALADEITWCAIWDAVKRETKAKHKNMAVNSEEFLKIAGERFTEVIVNTQVYDSVLSRSANMRSKGVFMNILTAFMAEPTTTANMVEQAYREAKKGNYKKAMGNVAAVGTSVVINSLLVSLVYAMRDDDEEERFHEKYLKNLTSEILDGFNPLTYYPLIKDIWSIFQGWKVERVDMSLIQDLYDTSDKALKETLELFEGMQSGDLSEEEIRESLKAIGTDYCVPILGVIGNMMGVPLKNIIRDVDAVLNTYDTFAGQKDNPYSRKYLDDVLHETVLDQLPFGHRFMESKDDRLLDGMLSDNEKYLGRLKATYKTEEAYDNAVKAVIKNNFLDGEISESQAKTYLMSYNGKDLDDAEGFLDSWNFEKKYGFQWSERADAYASGQISARDLEKAIMEHKGKTAAEAEAERRSFDFKQANPDTNLTDDQIKNYYNPIKIINTDTVLGSPYDFGISAKTYTTYVELKAECKGVDKNGDGRADDGTVKKEVMAVINSLDLTKEQKDALYYDNGWVKGTLHEAPWR